LTRGYLLDTDVLSMLAPDRTEDAQRLDAWMSTNADDRHLFISVIVFMEIERGITLLERDGPSHRSRRYRTWLTRIDAAFAERILDIDRHTADLAGQLAARAKLAGHAPGVADSLIAAAAQRHDLTVLTRNIRHFEPLGVPCIDPYGAARI
jgi:toxin FitB